MNKKTSVLLVVALIIVVIGISFYAYTLKKNISFNSETIMDTAQSDTLQEDRATIQNPISIDNNNILNAKNDFVLYPESEPSDNILDCFGTDLKDLEASIAWRTSGTDEGVFCNMVYAVQDDQGEKIQVIKEYSIPGRFEVIKSPFVTGLFGGKLIEGKKYDIGTRYIYSDEHVVIGGPVGHSQSSALDQFGVEARSKTISITASDLNRTWTSESENTYENCLVFESDYQSTLKKYAIYEHIWCDTDGEGYSLVERVVKS